VLFKRRQQVNQVRGREKERKKRGKKRGRGKKANLTQSCVLPRLRQKEKENKDSAVWNVKRGGQKQTHEFKSRVSHALRAAGPAAWQGAVQQS